MYNNPSGDITKVTLGPGTLYLGAVGSTPAVDVGYVKGEAVITIERKQVEIRQGSPQTIIDALVSEENAMIEFTGIEWNLDNLTWVLADGVTSVSGAVDTLKVGGKPVTSKRALRFQHIAANGSTVTFDMWKCIGEGQISIKANPDNLHEFPYKFKAIDPGTTDWAGASLTDGQKLVRIQRTRV
jgi:hypothetical protein